MNLAQQHIVILGGSSGIGLGLAAAAAARGAAPTLVSRSPSRLAGAAAQLTAWPAVRTVAADVSREADVEHLFRELPPAHHVVVTAVEGHYQPIRRLELAAARRTIESKLVAALHVAKHARFADGGGSLTFTAGVASERPIAGGAVIAAVNGALGALVRALALELAPVRVNALSPGWIDTPIWDEIAGSPTAKAQRFAEQTRRLPVGRVGTPLDTAEALLFLMSSGFTTGAVLHVDGGHRLV